MGECAPDRKLVAIRQQVFAEIASINRSWHPLPRWSECPPRSYDGPDPCWERRLVTTSFSAAASHCGRLYIVGHHMTLEFDTGSKQCSLLRRRCSLVSTVLSLSLLFAVFSFAVLLFSSSSVLLSYGAVLWLQLMLKPLH